MMTLPTSELNKAVKSVANVCGSRATLPVLSCVLVRADGDHAEFTATDLDVTVTCRVKCEAEKPIAVALPTKRLAGIATALTGSDVALEVSDKNLCSIQSGSSLFKVHGIDASEFPPTANVGGETFVLPQKKLRQALRRTAFAASTDPSRFILNSVLIEIERGKLSVVATDGRRMALVQDDPDCNFSIRAVLLDKAVTNLLRVLGDDGKVVITVTETHASFTLRDENGVTARVITKLIEGKYPDYRQVIPEEGKERVVVNRVEFLDALRRASVMTSEKYAAVKLAFAKNNLAITANTPDVGEARETLSLQWESGDLEIAFDPRFLIEPLEVIERSDVVVTLNDALSPAVLLGCDETTLMYVVMPMRIN